MFHFFFYVILLQQGLLLLDKFLISNCFHLKLLVYDEAIRSIGQLWVEPWNHLFGLVSYRIHLPGRFRLFHSPIHCLLCAIEVLVKHFILNRVVSEL